MLRKILIIPFVLLSFTVYSQEEKKEIELITITIENYFNGYIQRDSVKLLQAFDMQNGAMKVPGMSEDGKEYVGNNLFNDLIPRWYSREKLSASELEDCQLEIQNIDVVEAKIASAKIHMKVGETTYVDILSLQKMNQAWKITNKIFIVSEH